MFFEKWAEKLKEKNGSDEEIVFKNFEEEKEEPVAKPREEEPKAPAQAPAQAPVQSPATAASIEGSNIELKIVRPASFDEIGSIADHLIAGCTVVLNLELLDRATIVRMLDFLNGVTYTMDGEIKNVAQSTFIITPGGVDVND